MYSFNLHQTSGHAVLIIHLHSINPASVSLQTPTRHSAAISFQYSNNKAATTLATEILIEPVLSQAHSLDTPLIHESSYSVTPNNIVIRFRKTTPS
ncbi:hypothetical protein FBU30_006320, partial [Linnemannia zychae]